MKAKLLFLPAIYVAGAFMYSCQKEALPSPGVDQVSVSKTEKTQEHKLKGNFITGHYSFVPDVAGGYVAPNPAPAWYAGTSTEAYLNLLGKSQAFLNMYATFGPGGLQGTAAPINLFFADELSDMGISLPDAVGIILFDKQGNSIWARANGIITITPVSSTQAAYNFDAEILGGTGKFENATGSFTGYGYFNPHDTNDVGFEIQDGTIVY